LEDEAKAAEIAAALEKKKQENIKKEA